MRTAAGILLILTAVINLFAAFGYLVGGSAAGGLGLVAEKAPEIAQATGAQLTEEERTQMAEGGEEAKTGLLAAGGLLLAFGLFLLVSVGVLIAGAVFLFQGQNATFVMAAGIM